MKPEEGNGWRREEEEGKLREILNQYMTSFGTELNFIGAILRPFENRFETIRWPENVALKSKAEIAHEELPLSVRLSRAICAKHPNILESESRR